MPFHIPEQLSITYYNNLYDIYIQGSFLLMLQVKFMQSGSYYFSLLKFVHGFKVCWHVAQPVHVGSFIILFAFISVIN